MVKAAVIGVGYLGKFHAEKYFKLPDVELVALVDTDEKEVRKLAKNFRAQALSDYRLLPQFGVQCVSIVTPTTSHFEIARWCLEHEIDVLLEKPMTTTLAEAQTLIDIARKKERILQIGHLERFNPAFRAVKAVLTNPVFFEVRRITKFSGRGHDVDVILDLMIHDIDIVRHLVGRPIERVEAIGTPIVTESVDVANARITFQGGVVANVSASRAAFNAERTIRIFQPHVYVSLNYGEKTVKIYKKSDKKSLFSLPSSRHPNKGQCLSGSDSTGNIFEYPLRTIR